MAPAGAIFLSEGKELLANLAFFMNFSSEIATIELRVLLVIETALVREKSY